MGTCGTCHSTCVGGSEGRFWGLVLSFHHMSPGDPIMSSGLVASIISLAQVTVSITFLGDCKELGLVFGLWCGGAGVFLLGSRWQK